MSPAEVRTARRVAWATVVVAGGLTIAAQVAHVYVVDVRPSVGAVVASVAWPVLTLAALELMLRVPWPSGLPWQATRLGGVGGVGLLAAVASYTHVSGLLIHYGEGPVVAYAGPIAIDGLLLMAAVALIACGRADTQTTTGTATQTAAIDDHGSDERRARSSTTIPPTVEVTSLHPSTVGASPSTTPAGDVTPAGSSTDTSAVGVDQVVGSLSVERRAVGSSTVVDEAASASAASAAGARSLVVVPRASRTAASKPSMVSTSPGSTVDDRIADVRGLIAAGELDSKPSAEAIRRAVGGSAAIARAVRDALTADPPAVEGSGSSSSGPVPVLDTARGTGGAA
ncbi:MAG: hypothetical protein ACRCYX_12505 [Dermatophilaceae bacterium]